MRSALKRFCYFIAGFAALMTDSATASEHWQWELSPFYAPQHSAAMKVALTYAPSSIADAGWRFRYEGRLSGWNDHSTFAPRSYVLEAEDSFYAGYQIRQGAWQSALYVGATIYGDNQFGYVTQYGASAIGQLLWLGNEGAFAGFEARLSSIDTNWSVNAVSGWPTAWGTLKLGPEAGISGNATGTSGRLGLAATGLTLAHYDLAIGGGAQLSDDYEVAPYVSVWLSGRF